MEINLSCLGTVGKTTAFDLCYLLAICIHKRLVFIIIVFFIIVMSYLRLSSGIFCQFYFLFAPYHIHVRLNVLYWLDPEGSFLSGVLPSTKLDAVSLERLYLFIIAMDGMTTCK